MPLRKYGWAIERRTIYAEKLTVNMYLKNIDIVQDPSSFGLVTTYVCILLSVSEVGRDLWITNFGPSRSLDLLFFPSLPNRTNLKFSCLSICLLW